MKEERSQGVREVVKMDLRARKVEVGAKSRGAGQNRQNDCLDRLEVLAQGDKVLLTTEFHSRALLLLPGSAVYLRSEVVRTGEWWGCRGVGTTQ